MDFAGLVLETLRRASHRVLHYVFSAPGYWEDQFEYIDIAINKDIYTHRLYIHMCVCVCIFKAVQQSSIPKAFKPPSAVK